MGTYTIPTTDDGCAYITNGTIGASSIEADNPDPGSFSSDNTFAIKIHAIKRERNYQKKTTRIQKPESPATDSAGEGTVWFIDMKQNSKTVVITGTLKDDSNSWDTGFDDIKVQLSWLDYLFNFNKVVSVVWGGTTSDDSRVDDIWVRAATGFTASIKKITVSEDSRLDSLGTKEVPITIELEKGENK